MYTLDLNTLELPEGYFENDPTVRFRAWFPLSGGVGVEHSAMVVIVLEPGNALGRHVDSAEEVLLVLEGVVEVTLGDEKGQLAAGQIGIVPTLVPHSIRNVGTNTARIIGFFPTPSMEANFVEAIMPYNTRVAGTPDVMERAASQSAPA